MGFFNKFKKKKIETKGPEKISFKDLVKLFENEEDLIKASEKKFFEECDSTIKDHIDEINKKVEVLENFDIESKKVEQRAKILVKQGLDKYLNSIRIFKKDLTKLEKKDISDFIKNSNKIFSDFEKNSFLFYHRATYLIGDEIGSLKNEIVVFFKELLKIFRKYEETINREESLKKIKSFFEEIKTCRIESEKIISEIKIKSNKIALIKNHIIELEEDKKKLDSDKEYLDNNLKKEELRKIKKSLTQEVDLIKSLIDFKKLASIFHSNEREMEKVKKYKQNFSEEFKRDLGEEFKKLISETSVNNLEIEKEIEKIKNLNDKMFRLKKEILPDKREKIEGEINQIFKEISMIKSEICEDEKRDKLIKLKENELLRKISQNLVKLGNYELI